MNAIEAYHGDNTPPINESTGVVELTPAQSRINAVSRVMNSATERASTLILTPEESRALAADFPDEAFRYGAAGKENLIYIEHASLRDRFNEVLGLGQWTILRTRPHWAEEYQVWDKNKNCYKPAVRVYADCALLIRGCLVAEGIGDMTYHPDNPAMNFGDAAEGAQTQAFRRCAKNFGVGIQAWKKDWCEAWMRKHPQGTRPAPAPKETHEKTDDEIIAECRPLIEGADSLDRLASNWKIIRPSQYSKAVQDELTKLKDARKAELQTQPTPVSTPELTAEELIPEPSEPEPLPTTEELLAIIRAETDAKKHDERVKWWQEKRPFYRKDQSEINKAMFDKGVELNKKEA